MSKDLNTKVKNFLSNRSWGGKPWDELNKKPLNFKGKIRKENWEFDNLLDKRSLNLEKKARDENCIKWEIKCQN